jgi:peptidoglycan hydrolase-like protein with peptidoglycan-binding domain
MINSARGSFARIVSALVVAALLGVGLTVTIPAGSASAATTLCDVTLRYGSTGDCVRRLQLRLNELGLNCGNQLAVDGQFGRLTRMRVYAFQGRNQIGVDGIVGPITRGKLAAPSEGLSANCASTVATRIRAIWPDSVQEKAIRVANCESGLGEIAVGGPNTNGTLDFGVFQFNNGGTLQTYLPGATTAAKIDAALHMDANIRAALQLYLDRGWQPWTCRYA